MMVETNAPTRTVNVQETRLAELLSDYRVKLVFVKSDIEKEGRISNNNRKLLFEYYRRITEEFWDVEIPRELREKAKGCLDGIKGIEYQWA